MNPHETFCLNTATHFTAIRGRTPRQRTREQFDTLDAAKEYGEKQGDGKTMIYAVNDLGNSAHICNA